MIRKDFRAMRWFGILAVALAGYSPVKMAWAGQAPEEIPSEEWAGSRSKKLSTEPVELESNPVLLMGANTLPSGSLALGVFLGYPRLALSFTGGLSDRIDLEGEISNPWTLLGQAWLVGAGGKINIFGHNSKFRMALRLRTLGFLYSDSSQSQDGPPPGLLLWPSFMVDLAIAQGSFYIETGAIFYVLHGEGRWDAQYFKGLPFRMGAEFRLTDFMNLTVNLDMTWLAPVSVFSNTMVGVYPGAGSNVFSGAEVGFLFLF